MEITMWIWIFAGLAVLCFALFLLFLVNSMNFVHLAKPAQIQIHIVISIYIPPSTLTLFIKTAHYFSFFLFLFK